MVSHLRSQDLWAGILFVVAGAVAVVLSSEYPMGSPVRMGPGYFPRALGYLLVVIGALVILTGLRRSAAKIELNWPWLILILIPGSIAAFAAVLQPLGLPAAVILLTVIAAGASHELRIVEALAMAVGMAGLFTIVFVKLVGLPPEIWPFFLR